MNTTTKPSPDINRLFACCPGNEKNFNYLISLLQKHVVVPFVGAGFSANFGYPGWTGFLKSQAERFHLPDINRKLEEKKFEEAASILQDKLGVHMMEYVMLQEFGDHIYKNTPYNPDLEILPRLFRNLLLTTNYDEVLEMLYAKVNGEMLRVLTPQNMRDKDLAERQIARGDAVLIKLHGDVRGRNFILTEEEYDSNYGAKPSDMNRPLPCFLRQILLSRIILFLGCSLEEDRTLDVIKQVRTEGSLSFALLPLPESTKNEVDPWKPILFHEENGINVMDTAFQERRDMLDCSSIIPIWYPFGEHEALSLFLREVSYRVRGVYLPSTTQLRRELDRLLNSKEKEPDRIYRNYVEAEELIRKNEGRFPDRLKLNVLKQIKKSYGTHGRIYERRKIMKDILGLTQRLEGTNSPGEALFYHDLGYTFEKYHYYKLLLGAMLRADEIMDRYERENCHVWKAQTSAKRELVNTRALVYISLGYAYLKNSDEEHAKLYYEKAITLREQTEEGILSCAHDAFILNGLYRYYWILKEPEKALESLDAALKIRQQIAEEEDTDLTQHIVNTHSNKIHVLLSSNFQDKVELALNEYRFFENEPHIQVRLKDKPDARQRILTDYGDILRAKGEYEKAILKYKEALEARNYLHFEDDFIACDLYLKISECLREMEQKQDEALEYRIQAFLIRERLLGAKHQETEKIWEETLELGKQLQYSEAVLKQRIEAQYVVRNFRYDRKILDGEKELIQYFGL